MKKKITRLILILITVYTFSFVLTGCGGSGGDELPADSIDYVEPSKIAESFNVGEATINLPENWYHEDIGSADAFNELHSIYFAKEKPEKSGDVMFVSYNPGVVNGATEEEQYRNYYESVATYYKSEAYPGSLATTEEQITRSGRPAYHLVLYSEEDQLTYDLYLFMVNVNDMIVLSEVHSDSSTDDYSKEYINFIRNVQTPLDLESQEAVE